MSENPPQQIEEVLRKLTESYRGVKFGRGVVGKTSHLTLVLFGLWGIILWRLSTDLVLNGCLLAGGAIATSIYCWWVSKAQKFAKENPAQALLDGAEFVEYQKFVAQIDGKALTQSNVVPGPTLENKAAPSRPEGQP